MGGVVGRGSGNGLAVFVSIGAGGARCEIY